jgi:hypothetical protein
MSKWTEDWRSNNIDSNHLFDQPMMQPPGFNLPRRQWIILNRLRTGYGRTGLVMHRWGLRPTPQCLLWTLYPIRKTHSEGMPHQSIPRGISRAEQSYRGWY